MVDQKQYAVEDFKGTQNEVLLIDLFGNPMPRIGYRLFIDNDVVSEGKSDDSGLIRDKNLIKKGILIELDNDYTISFEDIQKLLKDKSTEKSETGNNTQNTFEEQGDNISDEEMTEEEVDIEESISDEEFELSDEELLTLVEQSLKELAYTGTENPSQGDGKDTNNE